MFKRRVFISYSTKDKDKAGSLASLLEAEGFSVFFAPRTIVPSQDFEIKTERELARCHAFIVLISGAIEDSKWVRREISVALNRYNTKRLKLFIPIVIETDARVPAIIAKIHYHDATTGDSEDWKGIATQINKDRRIIRIVCSSVAIIILAAFLFSLMLWNTAADVRIIRLLPHPHSDERQNEEVTVKNFSSRPVNLKGWKLRDTKGKFWILDDLGTLESSGQPGDQKTIKRNGQSMGLNNTGDTIQLINAGEKVVHSVVYHQVEEGKEISP